MNSRLKQLSVMAMLVAVSIVLVWTIHIPFPLATFLVYDPADVAILIGAFAYGPLSGILLTVVASVIQGVTVSADGGIYGIIMHILATSTLVLISSVAYRIRHTRGGAAAGLFVGTFAMAAVMMIANHFITPFYMMVPTAAVDQMLIPIVLPFNLLKAGINSIITFLVYKVVSRYLVHGEFMSAKEKAAAGQ